MTIRQANTNDVDQIRFLFRDTVTFVNSADYNPDEIKVWADHYKNTDSWTVKIIKQYFIVAVEDSCVVGFSSIADNGYLDFMYVHKDFQRQNIATSLLKEIESRADNLSLDKIFSHVSKTAQPFFKKNGFVKTSDTTNTVDNVKFINAVMVKCKGSLSLIAASNRFPTSF